MADVIQQIKSGEIHNHSKVVLYAGNVYIANGYVVGSIAGIEDRLTEKFDDVGYYPTRR